MVIFEMDYSQNSLFSKNLSISIARTGGAQGKVLSHQLRISWKLLKPQPIIESGSFLKHFNAIKSTVQPQINDLNKTASNLKIVSDELSNKISKRDYSELDVFDLKMKDAKQQVNELPNQTYNTKRLEFKETLFYEKVI